MLYINDEGKEYRVEEIFVVDSQNEELYEIDTRKPIGKKEWEMIREYLKSHSE